MSDFIFGYDMEPSVHSDAPAFTYANGNCMANVNGYNLQFNPTSGVESVFGGAELQGTGQPGQQHEVYSQNPNNAPSLNGNFINMGTITPQVNVSVSTPNFIPNMSGYNGRFTTNTTRTYEVRDNELQLISEVTYPQEVPIQDNVNITNTQNIYSENLLNSAPINTQGNNQNYSTRYIPPIWAQNTGISVGYEYASALPAEQSILTEPQVLTDASNNLGTSQASQTTQPQYYSTSYIVNLNDLPMDRFESYCSPQFSAANMNPQVMTSDNIQNNFYSTLPYTGPPLPTQTILQTQTILPVQQVLPNQSAIPVQQILTTQTPIPVQQVLPNQSTVPGQQILPTQTALSVQTVLPTQQTVVSLCSLMYPTTQQYIQQPMQPISTPQPHQANEVPQAQEYQTYYF